MTQPVPPHATIQLQTRKCGRECPRCPHGPYYYAFWRDRTTGRLRSAYVGNEAALARLRASWPRTTRPARARFGDMAEIGRSHGLHAIIWPNDHPPPHVHFLLGRGSRRYGAQLVIETGRVLEGHLPAPVLRMARAWLAEHRETFRHAWNELRAGRPAPHVPPYVRHRRRP